MYKVKVNTVYKNGETVKLEFETKAMFHLIGNEIQERIRNMRPSLDLSTPVKTSTVQYIPKVV